MMTPTQLRFAVIGVALGVAVLLGISWWRERQPLVTVESAVAHEHTEAAQIVAAKAETVYVAAKAAAAAGRGALAPKADSLFAHPTDTVRVKEFATETKAVLVKDAAAIHAADSVIADLKTVTASVRAELALAQQVHAPPRFSAAASALYDPLAQTPAASIDGAFRVIGHWSLVARGEQRFATGESPRAYVGVRVGF